MDDLFRQAEKDDRAHISVSAAIDIILSWINTKEKEAIDQASVWETMLLLDISREDHLSFLMVAKVAALVSRVVKKQLKESLVKLGMSQLRDQTYQYKKLKSVKANVIYNSLGEMSVEKMAMSDKVTTGMPNGRQAKWNMQTSKVMLDTHSITSSLPSMPARLEVIPAYFEEHFRSKFLTRVELVHSWDCQNPHWVDQRRAIRVARTLLDMRCTKQHELIFNVAQGHGSATTVEGLPRLLILYFERMFGHARLNVSHHDCALS